MSIPGDLSTLSDAFMAYVALAALKPSTTTALRERLEQKMRTEGHAIPEAKAADFRAVIAWLRKNERGEA